MIDDFWRRPRASIRPDHMISEAALLDILDMEPGQARELAEWRKNGTGPLHTTLPNGEIRYYGWSVISITWPEKRPDARNLFEQALP